MNTKSDNEEGLERLDLILVNLRQQKRELYYQKVREVWLQMDHNERHGLSFGLFPHDKMQQAENEGYDGQELIKHMIEYASQLSKEIERITS